MEKTTYIFDADFISQNLKGFSEDKCLAFGVFLLERALPAFLQFQIESGCGGGGELRAALAQCWHVLENGPSHGKSFVTTEACEARMPDSEVYTSIYTSAAIDVVNIACNLLSYLAKRDLQSILEAAESRRDTIDLFVQNRTCISGSGNELERKITTHPLMQQELGFIYGDIDFLNSLDSVRQKIFSAALRRVVEGEYCQFRLKL